MSSAVVTKVSPRVLLGPTGQGDDWTELRDHLAGLGWRVDPFDPIPPSDGGGPEMTLPRLDDVDHVILVVSGSGPKADLASGRLSHVVGVLQGRLGFGRVTALVEEGVEPFLFGTGITELPFKKGNLQARFSQVAAQLSESLTPDASSALSAWLERFRFVERSSSPEAWLIGGVLIMAVTVLLASLVQIVGSSGDQQDALTTVGPLTAVLGGALGVEPEPGQGSVTALPARCVVGTGHGVLVPERIACEGAGQLLVDGFRGPWHHELGQVSVDAGVVATVMLATGGSGGSGAQVQLEPGAEQSLRGHQPADGVDEISLLFSAHGQRVRLHQRQDRGGNELTLTFSLGL